MSNDQEIKVDVELERRVSNLRKQYKEITGMQLDNFFCPISLTDSEDELCRGHLTNSALDAPNIWVPQVKAVDNFFGSIVESNVVAGIQDRGEHPIDLICRTEKPNKLSVYFELNGKKVPYYFPPKNHRRVASHTYAKLVDENNNTIGNIAFKISEDEIDEHDNLQIILDVDLRPDFIGSVLKAAHLTMFSLQGYEYLFTESGMTLAPILRDFYNTFSIDRNLQNKVAIQKYFLRYSNYCMPLVTGDSGFEGTSVDNKVLFCIGMSDKIFAVGVLTKFKNDLFCTFLPGCKSEIAVYNSFISEPADSVRVAIGKYHHKTISTESHWEIYKNTERRLQLPHSGKTPDWVNDHFAWKKT